MTMRACALIATLVLHAGAWSAAIDQQEITPAGQAAVKRGLSFLASRQRPDGSFASDSGYGDTTAIVGCCALAFMGAGNTPDSGEYGVNVARCLQFLVRSTQSSGLVYTRSPDRHPMYHHALATLAMAEAWGMSQDKELRDALKRAVNVIVSTQNAQGGWRYNPVVADADLSVTVMELLALRAAKDAGMFVPKETIDLGIRYVLANYDQGTGSFCYQPGAVGDENQSFCMTGAGILSLQVAGNYRAKEVDQGVKYLLQYQPVGTRDNNGAFFFYGNYYASMGIYQAQSRGEAGRRAWNAWYPAITRTLISRQRADGGWDGGYDPYGTCMALLVLEIPYRYLPIYQR